MTIQEREVTAQSNWAKTGKKRIQANLNRIAKSWLAKPKPHFERKNWVDSCWPQKVHDWNNRPSFSLKTIGWIVNP